MEGEEAVPEELVLAKHGLREMRPQDVPEVTALYTEYMERFGSAFRFTEEEVEHQFLGSKYTANIADEDRFLWTYVVEVHFPFLAKT